MAIPKKKSRTIEIEDIQQADGLLDQVMDTMFLWQ